MNTNWKHSRGGVNNEPAVLPLVLGADGLVDHALSEEEKRFLEGWRPTSSACEKDVGESARIAERIRAVPMQCWFNARRVVLKCDDYADAAYVEGWALPEGMASLEHAWLVKDGAVVDPTLPTRSATYFPGLEFRGRAGVEEFLRTTRGKKCKRSPFFYAFGWGGGESQSFRRCFEDAQRAFAERHRVAASGETGSAPIKEEAP